MQALRLAKTVDMPREEWLSLRRKGIGGSDISAICGVNPWRSKMAVFLEKIEAIPGVEENEAIYWGTVLEDVVAQEFKKRNQVGVQRVNSLLQHPEYPMFLANIDRIIPKEKAILEIKTTNSFNSKEWDEDRMPDHVMMQIQWYLGVTGFKKGYLAALVGGQRYVQASVKFDSELWAIMAQEAVAFWELVEARTPPPMDGSNSSSEVLNMLYPTAESGKVIELPESAVPWIQQYEAAISNEKIAKAEKSQSANILKAMLGDAETGIIGDRKVTWKTITRKEHVVKASTFRQLKIK
jgi:putative phage-type endonuclease